MRLKVSKSKNSASFYVIKTVYEDKKERTVTVEKLGTEAELRKRLNGDEPYEWAKNYVKELNKKEKEQTREILLPLSQSKLLEKNEQQTFNGGYLFLQKIYHDLGINKICNKIKTKYKFTYNLDNILSRLIYSRILFPASKLGTYKLSENFLEKSDFELHHIYRSLEFIAKENDFIQSELYKNSLKLSKRNDKILYYDCTNYFFEIEQEEGIKQYGPSKEHRPNPIVEMGLFMDGDGIPLAFSISEGNKNEQLTLKPLEEKIINDFSLSKFVVCTDAGLSSIENRKFNNLENRAFITTQSIKKLKKHLRLWALEPEGWSLENSKDKFNINDIQSSEEMILKFKNVTFYKERWIKENGLEQKLIVTFSLKYKHYQEEIRNRQIERAVKILNSNPSSLKKHNQNDCKRFITKTGVTANGEIASKELYSLDESKIQNEAQYDGFYAVCTNLEDEAYEITKINHRRWEIEESFRIMKTEFKSRPVYLSRDDRIKAHFT
ncbi:MAG: IS1634 family transposase, partial [bacterium]|nr:IS1634 family transposase [bacterium]